MTSRYKRLAYAAGGVGVVVFVAWNLGVPSPTATTVAPAPQPSQTASVSSVAGPVAVTRPSPEGETSDRSDEVDYAIAVPELSGLSPDAAAGSLLDLWVAWDPPITEKPRVQPLLRAVRLSRIVPPVTPEGPAVALLTIRRAQVSDIIYGDRYGSLSVTMLAYES